MSAFSEAAGEQGDVPTRARDRGAVSGARRAPGASGAPATHDRRRAGSAGALRAAPLLRDLGSQHLQAIAEMGHLRRYRARDVLFEEGDPGGTLHVILEGVTRVVRHSRDGGEVLAARLGPGEVLGELSLIDGGVRSGTAIVEDPSTHVVITHEPFERWLVSEPAAALALLRTLVAKLRAADETLYSVTLQSLAERIGKLLVFQADADGTLRMTQSEMATRLGVTRESVNKHLRRLEASGAIIIGRGHCTVLDRSAVERAR